MELKFIHILGPTLVIVAFWVFGRGIINRTRGRRFRPLPAFLLLLAAVVYHFVVPKSMLVEAYGFIKADSGPFDMLLDRVTLVLMDFGIGMLIDAGYLAYKKHNSKLFWVPGVLALIISAAIYLFAAFIETIADNIRDKSDKTELLVEIGPDDTISELESVLHKYKADYEKTFPNISLSEDEDLAQYYSVFVDPAYVGPLSMELRNDRENVDQLETNHEVKLEEPIVPSVDWETTASFLANDPQMSEQWFANSLDYNGVHTLLKSLKPKRKAVVAIVDTGVDSDHEDIKGVFKKSKGDEDGHGHGTHCAGLAGAVTNNGKGVGSMNWEGQYIDIKGFSALNRNGFGSDRTVSQAIIDAAKSGADVISMSLGGPGKTSKAQADAIRYAFKQKSIVVVAAGNSNRDANYFSPASFDGVITVSAVDQNLNKASFSNTVSSLKMAIAAPGVDIMSSIPGSKYQKFSGTSMATPIVSGLVGIMRSFNPQLTAKEAHTILTRTGKKVSDSGKIGLVIQPKAAIEAVVPVPAM